MLFESFGMHIRNLKSPSKSVLEIMIGAHFMVTTLGLEMTAAATVEQNLK